MLEKLITNSLIARSFGSPPTIVDFERSIFKKEKVTLAGHDEVMKQMSSRCRYIQYCKSNCHPRLSAPAASMLKESYVKIRQDMRRQSNGTGRQQ